MAPGTGTSRFLRLRDLQSDLAVSRAWDGIVAHGRFNPTLSREWLSTIVDTLAPDRDTVEMLVLLSLDGVVSGCVPFYESKQSIAGMSLQSLEIGSNLMSYHAELLANGAERELLEVLLSERDGWDVFQFTNVVLDSRTARAITELAPSVGTYLQVLPGQESPYLAITGTWDEYLASRHKKFRYKLRQRRQTILDCSGAELRWFGTPAEVDRLMADILEVESKSWKADAGLAIEARQSELAYHRALLPMLARQGSLLAAILYLNGSPIAYSLCCHFGGWVGHLKTSFDQSHAELSPGGYVIDVSVERAFRIGAREFDFLGDAAPHKLAWTATTRKHADFFLFGRTAKGRLLGAAKRGREWFRNLRDPV